MTCWIGMVAQVLRLDAAVVRRGIEKHQQVLRKPAGVLADRVPATAAALGISVEQFGQLCRRHLDIAWLLPETAAMKASELAVTLGVIGGDVRKVLRGNPTLLLRRPAEIRAFVASGEKTLGVPVEAWQLALTRAPNLFNLGIGTIGANVEALAEGLSITPQNVIAAAMRNPPLLYQAPAHVVGRAAALAAALDVAPSAVVEAFCVAPSIMTREPAGLARRARLCVRVTRALGTPVTADELLRADGSVLTYAEDRLRRRLLLVRLGVWHGSWRSVVYWSDARIKASLARRLDGVVEGSRHARRLAAAITCLGQSPGA